MLKQLLIMVLSCVSVISWASTQKLPAERAEVTMQTLTLATGVGPLTADLYLPEGVEKPPVVIVTGAWTTVKEQMPAVYAKALATQGYATVTFDFRGWGRSLNPVRFLEDPTRKTEDIRAVITAVSKLDEVDGSRIAGVGVCASAGYMLDAAVGNELLSSVAVVAPWLHDKPMATAIYGGAEMVQTLLASAAEAISSEEPVVIEAASLSNAGSLMYQVPYYTETERGLIPQYDNQFNVASWQGWLNYDAQLSAAQQDKPVLMVASEAMALPAGAHQYLDNAGENVKAVWFEGISQFDFYDQPAAVNKAVAEISQHFAKSL